MLPWLTVAVLGIAGLPCELWAVAPVVLLPPMHIEAAAADEDPFAPAVEASTVAGRRVDIRDPAFLALRTVSDLFALEPGVVARDYLGGADVPLLSIRGSGAQSVPSSRGVSLFFDGIPWQRADGEFISGALDLGQLAGVRLWRGGDAVATGGSSLGGVVDFRSQSDGSGGSRQGRIIFGSGGRLGGAVRGVYAAGEGVGATSLSAERATGFREHHHQERQFLQQSLRWRVGDGAEARVSLSAVHQRFEVPGGLNPLTAATRPDGVSPGLIPGSNSGPAILRDDPARDLTLVRLAGSWWRGERTRARSAYVYLLASEDAFRRPIGFGWEDDDAVSAGAGWSLAGAASPTPAEHRWQVRLQADGLWNRNAFFHNRGGLRGTAFSRNALRAGQAVVALSDEWRFRPTLSLVLAAQIRWAGRSSSDRFDLESRPTLQVGPVPAASGGPVLAPSYPKEDTSFSWRRLDAHPRAALQWRPRPGWLAHVGASTASEAPTLSDFFVLSGGSPNAGPTRFHAQRLEAQSALTTELGGRFLGPAWSLEATAYRLAVRDELLAYDVSGAEVTINARGHTVHQGLEAAFSARLARALWSPRDEMILRVAWTLNDYRFDDDPDYANNRIAGQPRQVVGAAVSYRIADEMGAELQVHWQPQPTPVDHANTRYYDGFARIDVRLHRRVGRAWTAFVEVRNVADSRDVVSSLVVRRVASDTQANLFPGNPRHLVAGLSWSP